MRTSPLVGGKCGLSAEMMRKRVDLPQPDGPTIVTNSPLFGRSSTRNDTSWIATLAAAPCPKLLVTLWKATNSGRAPSVVLPGTDFADASISIDGVMRCSLSLRERVRVRGNVLLELPKCHPSHGPLSKLAIHQDGFADFRSLNGQ